MFFVSISLVIAAVLAVVIWGLRLGVDFKGGSVLELKFKTQQPSVADIARELSALDIPALKQLSITQGEGGGMIMKTGELEEKNHQAILAKLASAFPDGGLEEERFDSVGPVIGQELKRKSVIAVLVLLAAIIAYIALVFRKLSRVLSPWVMGVAAIVALLHDVLIPIGVFAALGHYQGVEITAVFVAAVLTILGYSVSDTVVVFDRIRENLLRGGTQQGLGYVMHESVKQTLVRSLNTTFTTLLSLLAIYFFGGESVQYFVLALILGIALGAYSSIFVASPLLVWWSRPRLSGK